MDAYGHHNGEVGVRSVEEWNRPIVMWTNHETEEVIAVINGASAQPPFWYDERKTNFQNRNTEPFTELHKTENIGLFSMQQNADKKESSENFSP